MTVANRIINEKCHRLELENGQLTEKLKRLSGLNAVANTLVNELKAEIRKLQEKSKSRSEEEIVKTEVSTLSVLFVPDSFSDLYNS